MISTDFDNKLQEIEILKLHPSLIPFVGERYAERRILHIGESHYLSQTADSEIFSAEYFYNNWWTDSCEEVLAESPGYVDTRHVVNDNYLGGISGSYGIFTNVVKTYSKVVLGREIKHISLEDKQLYNDFAFMNFYQMPSLYYGMKYWNSIYKSAKAHGNKKLASDLWAKCVESSVATVDSVVEIIDPKIIVFTSCSAWEAYEEYKKGFDSSICYEKIIHTSHPAFPASWNKPLKALDGKTGEKVYEDGLKKLL